jgi:hypothetical protein
MSTGTFLKFSSRTKVIAKLRGGPLTTKCNLTKKPKILSISRKRNVDKFVNVYFNYKILDQTEEMKYLVIYLDIKLNFNTHVDHTVAKAITLIKYVS